MPAAGPARAQGDQGRAAGRPASGAGDRPGAPKDFIHFCETTGHELVENRQDGDVYILTIKRAA